MLCFLLRWVPNLHLENMTSRQGHLCNPTMSHSWWCVVTHLSFIKKNHSSCCLDVSFGYIAVLILLWLIVQPKMAHHKNASVTVKIRLGWYITFYCCSLDMLIDHTYCISLCPILWCIHVKASVVTISSVCWWTKLAKFVKTWPKKRNFIQMLELFYQLCYIIYAAWVQGRCIRSSILCSNVFILTLIS